MELFWMAAEAVGALVLGVAALKLLAALFMWVFDCALDRSNLFWLHHECLRKKVDRYRDEQHDLSRKIERLQSIAGNLEIKICDLKKLHTEVTLETTDSSN